jgi:hypothetical protein
MKGAMAEPLAKTIKAPKNKRVRMMGNSQNFFLTLRKPHKSLTKSIIPLLPTDFHSLEEWAALTICPLPHSHLFKLITVNPATLNPAFLKEDVITPL